jgi:xylitol oxidase
VTSAGPENIDDSANTAGSTSTGGSESTGGSTSTGEPAPAGNWARNITFQAARVHRPASLDELRHLVAESRSVRTLGSGHSFNRIADTTGDLVSLAGLPREITFAPADSGPQTVTVSSGLRYSQIAVPIQTAGHALTTMASLPHISVAGAVATGTHGSGNTVGSLATAVSALRMVGPEGDLIELSRAADPDRFDGAVVALGALGIITDVTLDLVPSFDVAQYVYLDMPLDTVAAEYAAISATAYSVSVFTNWQSGLGNVWLKQRTDQVDAAAPQLFWLGARLAEEPQHPVPGMPPEYCTAQLGVPGPWYERLPHFRPDFTPSSGEELQSEFFLERSAAPAAIEALRRLGDRIAPVVQISEIRTIAADGLWLSPAYGRDSVAFHFTWIADAAAVDPVLAAVEEQLLPLGARPHWGKVFHVPPAQVSALYEQAPRFRELMREFDPHGKFRNAFVDGFFPPGD